MKCNSIKILTAITALTMSVFILGCKDDDEPKKEDVPELITKATLTFTPSGGGSVVIATATDPDGQGTEDMAPDGPINLEKDKSYVLTIQLINGLAKPGEEGYDITEEVTEEGDEHQFFFSWTKDAFSNPAGNGNVDNRADALNYTGGATSKDKNNRPLGLTTTWTTAAITVTDAAFKVLLKHQPDLKSDTSDSNTGETDLDIEFDINIIPPID